jgi:phosphoglycolate phosphatase-like HAD superfamily hydrolase
MQQLFPNDPRNRHVVATFEARKLQHILDKPLFPEVVPTMTLFKSKDVRRFICSSTKQEVIAEYARKTGIGDLVDGCFVYLPGFGKGKQIEFIVESFGLNPERVLFVGDSLKDHDFVEDQRVRFIGIRRMFDQREFQQRGLFSVQDLTALSQLWDQSESQLQFMAKA